MATKDKSIYDSEMIKETQTDVRKLAKEKPTKIDRQKAVAILYDDIKEALKVHPYEVVAARLTKNGFDVTADNLRQIISRYGKPKRTRSPKAEAVSDKTGVEETADKKPDEMPPEDSQVDNQIDTQVDKTEEVETSPRQKAENPKKRGDISTQPQADESNDERDEVTDDSTPVDLLDVI